MKDLQKIANECIAELNAIGISPAKNIRWTVNSRAKSRWGLCRKLDRTTYEIQISDRLLQDEVSDTATKDTIVHELLHTLPRGSSHTGVWAAAAIKVNRCYPHYCIKRTTSSAEKGIEAVPREYNGKYAIRCTRCGTEIVRERMSAIIQHPERYCCASCGGNLERIR